MKKIFQKAWAILSARQRRSFLLVLAGTIVMAAMEVVGIGMVFGFMSLVSDSEMIGRTPALQSVYDYMSPDNLNTFLLMVGLSVLIIFLVKNLVVLAVAWMQAKFISYSNYYMVRQLLEKFLAYPYSYYLRENTSSLRHIVFGEVDRVSAGVLRPMLLIISELVVGAAILGFLLWHDWRVSLTIITVMAGVYALIYFGLAKLSGGVGERLSASSENRHKSIAHAMDGIKEIKVLGNEQCFIENYGEYSREYARANVTMQMVGQVPRVVIETLAFTAILSILLYYLYLGQPMGSIIAIISLYALAGYRIMPSLNRLLTASTLLRSHSEALDAVHEKIFETEVEPESFGTGAMPIPFAREIRLTDITYQYPESASKVISDLNLVINANTSVGIIGASGAGKSTLIDILLGLLEPASGSMEVDGMNIDGAARRQWRSQIGYVPQQVFIFDDTLAKNIAFTLDEDAIDMDAVEKAARLAHLHDFVMEQLPQAYNTPVGERGVRLSGGQQQRIAIARALYREPTLLLLDEATSALDMATEKVITEAVHDMKGQRTVIIIAHRLSTVQACDLIYLMDNGRVIDSGAYDDLIDRHPEIIGYSSFKRA